MVQQLQAIKWNRNLIKKKKVTANKYVITTKWELKPKKQNNQNKIAQKIISRAEWKGRRNNQQSRRQNDKLLRLKNMEKKTGKKQMNRASRPYGTQTKDLTFTLSEYQMRGQRMGLKKFLTK